MTVGFDFALSPPSEEHPDQHERENPQRHGQQPHRPEDPGQFRNGARGRRRRRRNAQPERGYAWHENHDRVLVNGDISGSLRGNG